MKKILTTMVGFVLITSAFAEGNYKLPQGALCTMGHIEYGVKVCLQNFQDRPPTLSVDGNCRLDEFGGSKCTRIFFLPKPVELNLIKTNQRQEFKNVGGALLEVLSDEKLISIESETGRLGTIRLVESTEEGEGNSVSYRLLVLDEKQVVRLVYPMKILTHLGK